MIANHGRIHALTTRNDSSGEQTQWHDILKNYRRRRSARISHLERPRPPPIRHGFAPRIAGGADRHGFAPRSHCSSPPGLEGTTGTVTYPGFPPLLAHFPRGSDRARHSERGPRHANNGRVHTITSSSWSRTMDGSTHSRRRGTIPLGSSYNTTTIYSVLLINRLWRIKRTRTRVTSPPQAT